MNQENKDLKDSDEWNMSEEELDALEELEEEEDIQEGKRAIPLLIKPKRVVNKKEWDRVIKKNFPEFLPVTNIVLAGIGQLLIKGYY